MWALYPHRKFCEAKSEFHIWMNDEWISSYEFSYDAQEIPMLIKVWEYTSSLSSSYKCGNKAKKD